MGSSRSYVSMYLSLCLSVSLSLCLFGHPHRFLTKICAARNCVQRIRLQATGSNTLSGSIICPSLHPSVYYYAGLLQFLHLYSIVLVLEMITITITITSLRVQGCYEFIPTLGSEEALWGPVEIIYPSISLFICMSVCLYLRLVICIVF